MKKFVFSMMAVLMLVGCDTTDPSDRALGGAAIGGLGGAAIGGATTKNIGGAAVGGAIGAASGALIGAATAPRRHYDDEYWSPSYKETEMRCIQEVYDYYGHVRCLRWGYVPDRYH